MQQSEILSLAERLIPVYEADDFDFILAQLTEGEPSSTKVLVKMELNRLMAACEKSIDLRGRVQGECREYVIDGISHWLDDVAFNTYHKNIQKFGRYTEGMWQALVSRHTRLQTTSEVTTQEKPHPLTAPNSPFLAEPIHLGYDLKRQENRLKVQSQVEICLSKGQRLCAVNIDLSCSGAKFKVPSAFNYNLGEVIQVTFTEFARTSQVTGIEKPLAYRVLAIDDCGENSAVRYLRALRLTKTNIITHVIDEALNSQEKRVRHDNQDKIIRARTQGYEHIAIKHTSSLPLFFSGNELKLVMLTPNNQKLWQYWHDERNQQVFGSLFNQQRVASLIKPGIKGATNVLYSFTHEHEKRTYFYSMLRPEATREQRQLFWHIGAKRASWRAFKISTFELSEQEKTELSEVYPEFNKTPQPLTHIGILQEIADEKSAQDYLFTDKPRISANTLNEFRHPRRIIGNPKGIYFDATSRRKELRYRFKTPLVLDTGLEKVACCTVDISKRGLGIQLDTPTMLRSGQQIWINFRELQLYNKKLPLSSVPYKVIRVSPDGYSVQLVIDENSQTMRVIAFFNTIIKHNQDKLIPQNETLPSNALLERLHSMLLSRVLSTPVFISKSAASIKTPVIGVNLPMPKHIDLFTRLGQHQFLSLEPIFKGRTNTLIADPIRRIEGAKAKHQDIYLSATKAGNKITGFDSKLYTDFKSVEERIQFIKKARVMGDFYVLRLSTAPIFDPMTSLLEQALGDLTQCSKSQSAKLEKELTELVGYSEIENITDEILTRLELD